MWGSLPPHSSGGASGSSSSYPAPGQGRGQVQRNGYHEPPPGPPHSQNGSGGPPPPHHHPHASYPLPSHSNSHPHSYPLPHGPPSTTSSSHAHAPPPHHFHGAPHPLYQAPPLNSSHGQPHQQQPPQQPPPSDHANATGTDGHSHSHSRHRPARYSPLQEPPIEQRRNTRRSERDHRSSPARSHRSSPYYGKRSRRRSGSRGSHSPPPRRKRRRSSSPFPAPPPPSGHGVAAYDDLKRQNEELTQQVVDLKRTLTERKAKTERASVEHDAKLRHKYEKNKDKLKKNSVLLYKFRFYYPDAEDGWNRDESKTEKKFWSLYNGDVDEFWHEAIRHLYDFSNSSDRSLQQRDMAFLKEYLVECMSNRMYRNRVDKFHHFWKLYTNFEMLMTGVREEWLRTSPGISVTGFMSRREASDCLCADHIPINTCLIRFSTDEVGRYTITFKTRPNHVDHADVVLEGRTLVTYLLKKPELRFRSLRDLFLSEFWKPRLSYFYQPDGTVMNVFDVLNVAEENKDDDVTMDDDVEVDATGSNAAAYSPTRSPDGESKASENDAQAEGGSHADAAANSGTDGGGSAEINSSQELNEPPKDGLREIRSPSPPREDDDDDDNEYMARARALLDGNDDDHDDDVPNSLSIQEPPPDTVRATDTTAQHSSQTESIVGNGSASNDSGGASGEDNASPQYEPSPSSPSYSPMVD